MRKISLNNGTMAVDIHPECGGGLGALRMRGEKAPVDLLWPTSEEDLASGNVARMSCLPVTPFAGAPAGGKFTFRGQQLDLTASAPAGGLPSRRWIVQDASNVRATLTWFHAAGADGWPWEYQVLQRVELMAGGVRVYVAMTNVGADVMPGAIGLSLNVERRRGITLSGGESGPAELRGERQIGDQDFDARFDGRRNRVQLVWPSERQALELIADPAFACISAARARENEPIRITLSSTAGISAGLTGNAEAGIDMTLLEQGDTLAGTVLLTVPDGTPETGN